MNKINTICCLFKTTHKTETLRGLVFNGTTIKTHDIRYCNDHDALHQIITSFPIVAHTLVNMYCQRILDNNCHTPQGCLASSSPVCY